MPATFSGTTGLTFNDGSKMGSASSLGMRNRIINGDMRIDQRNAGAAITPTDGQYSCDRWGMGIAAASKFTAQQNAGAVTRPVGFANYLGITSTSAYSVAAGDIFNIGHGVEGFNTDDFQWGSANAKAVTLSFQVYSSLTGTFGGALRNSAGSRCYPFTYSVTSANTWTSVSITVAGDTTGTWVGSTNGTGIRLSFGLGVGTTYSGTANTWAGINYYSATGAVSVVGTSGATFYITGVQLEAGSVATPFERRPIGVELALCQRYYQRVQESTLSRIGVVTQTSTSRASPYKFITTFRATPTVTVSGGSYYHFNSATGTGAVSASANAVTVDGFYQVTDGVASQTTGTTVAVDNWLIVATAEL